MESLEEMRKSIDNIDNAIIAMFAERFKVTDRIGLFKASSGLAPKDESREAVQFARISELAEQYGLDQQFARNQLEMVIARVVERHLEISEQHQTRTGPHS
ncbi:MAG: chorismate mutase [Pseudomonadota bacterium]